MAVSSTHTGWRYDPSNSRLDFYYRGTRVGAISTSGLALAAGTLDVQNSGAVAQLSSKTTGVTLNTHSGQITMDDAALAAGAEVVFTVTNSKVAAKDVVIVNVASATASADDYLVGVGAVGAGSFGICVANLSAGALTEELVLNFVVIKGTSS